MVKSRGRSHNDCKLFAAAVRLTHQVHFMSMLSRTVRITRKFVAPNTRARDADQLHKGAAAKEPLRDHDVGAGFYSLACATV